MTIRIQNIYLASATASQDALFYREALGLELRFADEDHWIQMSAGGANFALAGPRESAVEKGFVVVFEVADIEAAAEAVVQAGGAIIARRDMGDHGVTVTASDPSGNVIQLFRRA